VHAPPADYCPTSTALARNLLLLLLLLLLLPELQLVTGVWGLASPGGHCGGREPPLVASPQVRGIHSALEAALGRGDTGVGSEGSSTNSTVACTAASGRLPLQCRRSWGVPAVCTCVLLANTASGIPAIAPVITCR
jgi:hypothetical protein